MTFDMAVQPQRLKLPHVEGKPHFQPCMLAV